MVDHQTTGGATSGVIMTWKPAGRSQEALHQRYDLKARLYFFFPPTPSPLFFSGTCFLYRSIVRNGF
jgi:hypothetical protein